MIIKWQPGGEEDEEIENMSLRSQTCITTPVLILLHLYQIFARCYYSFDSRENKSGNFSSPLFPSNYPGGVTCHYVFSGEVFEGLKIVFHTFELEEPYVAGCLKDYLDVTTVSSKNEKHLVGRYCGSNIPSPILTMQPQAEIVFRTDYATQRKGFYAIYEFLHEKDVPSPSSRPQLADCGGLVKGVGGVLTSPGYPKRVPNDLDCIWVIRVEPPKHIHVRVAELQFQGSPANCDRMNLTVFDGYVNSASPRGSHEAKSMCGDLKYYRNVDDRFILSPRNRLTIRFQVRNGIAPVNSGMVGFKIIWTEVMFLDMDKCTKFACKRSHYCIRSGSSSVCKRPQQYCIDSSLVCDGVQNCSDEDNSDEDDCYIPLMIGIGATVPAVLLVILVVAIVTRRQLKVKKSCSQSQNLTMHLRQLEHSPSSSSNRKMATSYSQPCDLLTPTLPEMMNGGGMMAPASPFDTCDKCSSFKTLPMAV